MITSTLTRQQVVDYTFQGKKKELAAWGIRPAYTIERVEAKNPEVVFADCSPGTRHSWNNTNMKETSKREAFDIMDSLFPEDPLIEAAGEIVDRKSEPFKVPTELIAAISNLGEALKPFGIQLSVNTLEAEAKSPPKTPPASERKKKSPSAPKKEETCKNVIVDGLDKSQKAVAAYKFAKSHGVALSTTLLYRGSENVAERLDALDIPHTQIRVWIMPECESYCVGSTDAHIYVAAKDGAQTWENTGKTLFKDAIMEALDADGVEELDNKGNTWRHFHVFNIAQPRDWENEAEFPPCTG